MFTEKCGTAKFCKLRAWSEINKESTAVLEVLTAGLRKVQGFVSLPVINFLPVEMARTTQETLMFSESCLTSVHETNQQQKHVLGLYWQLKCNQLKTL
jgi:hypothetical protein